MWASVRDRPPTGAERARVERALYLFQLLVCFCQHMAFRREEAVDRAYIAACHDKVAALQRCLVTRLMAPWEMYQVIAIQAYFRRAIHGFEHPPWYSERVMPGILSAGLDLMHATLCQADGGAAALTAAQERAAQERPFRPLCIIASRGFHQTWTRTRPGPATAYRPFGTEADAAAYASWRTLEETQLRLVGTHQAWADLLEDRLAEMEGRLDLWSAALWDPGRWADMFGTVRLPNPDVWRDLRLHWNPMSAGFHVLAHPEDVVVPAASPAAAEA
ncbi:hypothetical protein CDD83_3450 [Cordyceps sp. RAO-2017]|nr:hypothetical protein CDD83_3450 [Cordyceps sp. RAO-2017]